MVAHEDVLAAALEKLVMAYLDWTGLPPNEAWRVVMEIAREMQDADV